MNSAVEVGMNFERCLERTKDERHTVHGSDEWGGRSMQSDRDDKKPNPETTIQMSQSCEARD